jgi:PleD family two-component response regulator
VVRAADKALYMCKNHGRNQIRMVRIKEPEPIAKTV